MKDYSAMSDFEINAAVSICLGIEYAAPPEMTGDGWKYSEGYFEPQNWDNPHRLQDYCNNPADAWPLLLRIVESGVILNIGKNEINGDALNGKSIARKITELYLGLRSD